MTEPAASPVGFAERMEVVEWLAVVATSADPRDLDEDVERLMALAPRSVVVERVSSHAGLAEALGVSGEAWWAGIAAPTRARLERSLRRITASTPFEDRDVVVGRFRLVRLAG
jgi:hypothetical protein